MISHHALKKVIKHAKDLPLFRLGYSGRFKQFKSKCKFKNYHRLFFQDFTLIPSIKTHRVQNEVVQKRKSAT